MSDWSTRHHAAMAATKIAINTADAHESAIVALFKAWQAYASAHHARYETEIGNDGVLGPEWQAIGEALRGLLNGETGRLDCGTVDASILHTMRENAIDTSKL